MRIVLGQETEEVEVEFTQHVVVYSDDPDGLRAILEGWNAAEAGGASGYRGGRLLAFRDKPGRYVIQADFASWDDAQKNNERPETQEWAAQLMELVNGEPKYENLDVLATFG